MTISKIFKNKYFLYIMCIFIVFAAWGTLVFHAADDNGGTQFFAVKILEIFKTNPPHSLSEKRLPEFVAWINYNNGIYENSFDRIVNNIFIKSGIIFNIVYTTGQAIVSTLSDSGRIIRYLRI